MKSERTVDQLTAHTHHGCIESFTRKNRCGVRSTGCSISCPVPPFFTICGTCPRSTTHRFGIIHAGDELSVPIAQVDGTAIAVEFEGRLITLDVIRSHPHNQITLSRNSTYIIGHLPLGQIVCIIAEVHTCQVDTLCIGVIYLDPAVEIRSRTHHYARIRGHHFVDDKSC